MAKSGLLALTRHVASRWGREGIRANGVAPGLIVAPERHAELTSEFLEQYATKRSPRVGRPDDIGAMVAFLCSDDGEWINGQVLHVNGGELMP